jgi:hypothetical protein
MRKLKPLHPALLTLPHYQSHSCRNYPLTTSVLPISGIITLTCIVVPQAGLQNPSPQNELRESSHASLRHPPVEHPRRPAGQPRRRHPRRLLPVALVLCLLPFAASSPAQQPEHTPAPTAPLPATPIPQTPGHHHRHRHRRRRRLHPQRRIILTATASSPTENSPPQQKALTALTANDGSFILTSIPPGPFTLTIVATGFATRQVTGQLQPSQALTLDTIVLVASSAVTEIQVTATQTEIAQAQIGEEEKQRVLGIIPNFYVSYVSDPVPLTPARSSSSPFTPLSIRSTSSSTGPLPAVQQATDTYAWGEGVEGYSKRYAAAYGNFLTGTLIGDAALPILFKQDPRYFYKGTGTIRHRALYAIANAVICKGDNHHWQVNYSAILGGLASGALSNLYYPAPNRSGVGLTFEAAGFGTAISAASNLLQEFLIPKLTPHIPPKAPPNP